jgi:hypothetical protein
MAQHGAAWHSMARHGAAQHGAAWRGTAWHGMAWHGMAWGGMAHREGEERDLEVPLDDGLALDDRELDDLRGMAA